MEKKEKNIYEKLLVIQQKVNGLAKDKKGNNYSYVTGDKVLSWIKPLMNDLGLILKQEVISLGNERMDYKTGIGTPYEKPKSEILSKVMMRFTWVDCSTKETDVNLFAANGQNDWEKGLGSALTYGERYFLLKYFHIATDEDDVDNDERKKEIKNITSVSNMIAPITVDVEGAKAKLIVAKDLEDLKIKFELLSKTEKKHSEVIALKDKLKNEFSNTKP